MMKKCGADSWYDDGKDDEEMMKRKIRVVVTEKRDFYVNTNTQTPTEARLEIKNAIELVGLSNIDDAEGNVLEQDIEIDGIDIDDIEQPEDR